MAYEESLSRALIDPKTKSTTYIKSMSRKISSNTYTRRHLDQYKTHGQNPPIVGYFNTWTRLTEKDIHKMTKAEATIKGHLSQTRKNSQSTTTKNIVEKTRAT